VLVCLCHSLKYSSTLSNGNIHLQPLFQLVFPHKYVICFLCTRLKDLLFYFTLDPPEQASVKASDVPVLEGNATSVQLHCYTDQYNGNCTMNWNADTYNLIEARSSVVKEDPGILKSSVNITVDKKNIGTNVNCTVSCDFIETTTSAAYTIDAHCMYFIIIFLNTNPLPVIVKLIITYSHVNIHFFIV